jgi:REP element-mobilizing transposase RayT
LRAKEFSYTRQRVERDHNSPSPLAGDTKTMSHANLLYHIVFGTKGRLPLINNEIRPRFYAYLGGVVRGLGGIALEINGMADHVHLLVKLKPTIAIADFLRDLKSNSSTWAKQNGMPKFAWQRRYGAFTVSESQLPKVRNYIRRQEEHHQGLDFKAEFEKMLLANGIKIDDFTWQD